MKVNIAGQVSEQGQPVTELVVMVRPNGIYLKRPRQGWKKIDWVDAWLTSIPTNETPGRVRHGG